MKKMFFPGIILCIVLSGCSASIVRGSGNIVSQDRYFSDFSKVKGTDVMEFTISRGDAYAILIEADDNIVDEYLTVEKILHTLDFSLEALHTYKDITVRITIQMPALTGIELEDCSIASISGFNSDNDCTIDLEDASKLTGSITTGSGKTSIILSDASYVSLIGASRSCDMNMEDASQAALTSFIVSTGNYALSDSSRADISCTDFIRYDLSDSSHLVNSGNPVITSGKVTDAASYSE